MKPITDEITKKNVDYIVDGITEVIKTFDVRDAGSKGEADAQAHFAKILENYADEVKVEKFKLRPDSFMGWIYFDITFILIALVALWFNLNIVALLLCIASLALCVLQLIFYKHVTSPFFPEKTSSNVYAVKKPTREVKRRIVFSGHTDAAFEWGWLNLGGFPLFATVVLSAFAALFAVMAIAIAGMFINEFSVGLILPSPYRTALIIITAFAAPAALLLVHFSNRKKVVDGANDNLTACLTALAVLKTMKDEDISFENTEVCALMSGSEEAGLRGAMAFAEAHKGEFDDVETIFVVLETLREPEHLSIYQKDMNGTVKVDADVCRLIQKAGKEAIDREIPLATVTLGSTDAAAFTKAGLKSACFAALDHKLQPYYHTRKDSYDNLNKDCLALCYKTCMKTLELFDRDGLNE
ncbi:MAG: M20/M25/M40 family metallo-hydrolase [Clostridia bacterium]